MIWTGAAAAGAGVGTNLPQNSLASRSKRLSLAHTASPRLARSHARTKRNDFPVGLTPQPPIRTKSVKQIGNKFRNIFPENIHIFFSGKTFFFWKQSGHFSGFFIGKNICKQIPTLYETPSQISPTFLQTSCPKSPAQPPAQPKGCVHKGFVP